MAGRSHADDPDALFADWLDRSGTAADFERLCAAHARHAAELRKLHAEWQRIALPEERGEAGAPPTSQLLERLRNQAASKRYRLQGEIARGGMGAILKIWDEDLRRNLAMKVILGHAEVSADGETPPVDPQLLARFLEEAQVTGQLDHPGIVPVHELGLDAAGRVYFTMKLVKGRDLKQVFDLVFEERGAWNETRALGVILKVCEAMAYAHTKGVIHRDLKPGNVMVGSFGEVYVMDWGLARVLGQQDTHDLRLAPEPATTSLRTERRDERAESPDSPLFTMDGDVVGTPSYMPPEQARGEVERLSARSDVYSIGALLYHLLARQMPYCPPGARVTNRTVLAMVLHGPPIAIEKIRKDVPAELIAICDKAMAREPEARYASTLELAEDLRAYLERRVVRAYETGAWAEARKWVQRNRLLAAALAAAVLLLVAGMTATLVFKARADQRATDLQAANTRAEDNVRAARASLYHAAIAGAQSARRLHESAAVRRLLDSAPEELRNWEWRYLHAQSDTSLLTLAGHSAAFSRDGTRIVTASRDGTARVWEASSGQEIARLQGHTDRVSSAAFSPDGTRIVTASVDGTARVWDASTGKDRARLVGHTSWVASAAFSPDGMRIVTVSFADAARVFDASSGQELVRLAERPLSAAFSPDGTRIVTTSDNTARLYDASTGKELARLDERTNPLVSPAFSSDGTRIVAATVDNIGRVWDAWSGRELARLEGHTKELTSAGFSVDARRIVTASNDTTARVWDASSGQELVRLEGHTYAVASAAFSADGTRIVTASDDGTARVWDASSGQELARFEGHTGWVESATFSPDGTRVLTASRDDTARVWDASGGEGLARLDGHTRLLTSAAFNTDGTCIVTASFDGTARVWDASSLKELARLDAHTVAFGPGGTCIVTASSDDAARVRDASTLVELMCLDGHTDDVTSVAFSADGTRLVTASDDETARVWNASSGAEIARFREQALASVACSPDGTCIVTASSIDKTARIWSASSRTEIRSLEGHSSWMRSVAFSPDGTRIVTASHDRTARVWDASSGQELARLEGHTDGVQAAAFSPDGTRIVTASSIDKTARIWSASSRTEIRSLEGHSSWMRSVAFSPDGTRIVTASHDRTARVWHASSGQELARLEGHTDGVQAAAFSPDGTRIVTASLDRTARVWDASSGTELLRLEGHTESVESAVFSADGTRIVTASADGSARVWDTVPYRIRHAERQALLAARPTAERTLATVLARSSGFVEAGALLRGDAALEPSVRRVALDLLLQRSGAGRDKAAALELRRAEHRWLAHMLGLEPWPSEGEVEAALRADATTPRDPQALNTTAWRLVDPDAPPGDAMRALVLARRAVASAPADAIAAFRDTLARALFRLGRFDEALAEQRAALAESSPEQRPEFQQYLQRLEADVAAWRDESGRLRRTEWNAKLDALAGEIDALEQDLDVRLWRGPSASSDSR